MKDSLKKRIELLEKKLAREKKARNQLEEQIETKSRDAFVAQKYSRLLLNSVDSLIMVTDTNFKIIDINDSWGDQSYFIGRDLTEIVKLVKSEIRFKQKIIELGNKFETEVTVHINNTDIPCYIKLNIIESLLNIEQFLFTVTDLTVIKKIEENQKNMQEKLVRSAYADGLAESAISVLHNIGNILTALNSKVAEKEELNTFKKCLLLTQTALNKWDNLEDSKKLEIFMALNDMMNSSNDQLTNLFSFVSEKCDHISNIISSQQRYANLKDNIRTKTNLMQVLNDCIAMISDSLKKRNISIEIEDDDNSFVLTDKVGLAQVVLNILVNAMESIDDKLKSYPSGKEKIKIQIRVFESFVTMMVEDTGVGIDPKDVDQIFTFGYSTKQRSSGFGLHNCFNFMSRNGGDISVTSNGFLQGASVKLTFEKAS